MLTHTTSLNTVGSLKNLQLLTDTGEELFLFSDEEENPKEGKQDF